MTSIHNIIVCIVHICAGVRHFVHIILIFSFLIDILEEKEREKKNLSYKDIFISKSRIFPRKMFLGKIK